MSTCSGITFPRTKRYVEPWRAVCARTYSNTYRCVEPVYARPLATAHDTISSSSTLRLEAPLFPRRPDASGGHLAPPLGARPPDRAHRPWCTARTMRSSWWPACRAASRPSPLTPGSSSSRPPTPKASSGVPSAPCASTPRRPPPPRAAARSGGTGPTRSSGTSSGSGGARPWPWRSAPAATSCSRSPSGSRFTASRGSRPSPSSLTRQRVPTSSLGTTGGASLPSVDRSASPSSASTVRIHLHRLFACYESSDSPFLPWGSPSD